MREDGGSAQEREEQSVYGAPEVGGMADVIHIAAGHVPAVQQVKRGENIAGNRNWNQEDVDAHLRLEENGREQDGRDGARCAHGIVPIVIPVFDQVARRGDCDRTDVQECIQDRSCRSTEGGGEILFYDRTEEIQCEHIEE